jgi:hypothetical protein
MCDDVIPGSGARTSVRVAPDRRPGGRAAGARAIPAALVAPAFIRPVRQLMGHRPSDERRP